MQLRTNSLGQINVCLEVMCLFVLFVFVETIGQINSTHHMYVKTTGSLECSSENNCLCVLGFLC